MLTMWMRSSASEPIAGTSPFNRLTSSRMVRLCWFSSTYFAAGSNRQGESIMAAKKFLVELSADERKRLDDLISKGKAPAKAILKARLLLKADLSEAGCGWLDDQIVKALHTNLTMV